MGNYDKRGNNVKDQVYQDMKPAAPVDFPPHQPHRRGLKHWQVISLLLMAYDYVAVLVAYTLALLLRFDFAFSKIESGYWGAHLKYIWLYAAVVVAVHYFIKLYRSMWRFASYTELARCIQATIINAVILVVMSLLLHRMPASYYVFGLTAQFVFILGVRFAYRFVILIRSKQQRRDLRERVMLIGAGQAGQAILRDIVNGDQDREDKIVCIIDDNPNKWGRDMDNIPIVGGRESIFENVEKYKVTKIYFAIPSATAEERRDILQICQETDCKVKQLPGIFQLIAGDVRVTQMQDVSVEDLLGREPIRADMSGVFKFLQGKVVLVTGGGGSIGSELCRQVAAHGPKQLIIFDVYENNAYDIQLELREKYPNLDLVTLIGSVRDSRRVNQVFEKYHPDVVYHAAAHKHVPLMEDSPCESIKNNVIGTYKTAYAAMVHGCSRFVLISTDKAVNPTNIMGASKRLCEMVIQSFARKIAAQEAVHMPELFTHGDEFVNDTASPSPLQDAKPQTQFVAVRFGNVLGSNGSVIPIFKKQIAKGGPVTVTHPDIIRYFMTVPEAVSLVLLAGTYAHGGEIFVLDMGSPVKIDTLARNLIRMSGLKPDVDIKIEYTGLRPGEKLYEEKLMAEEGMQTTDNDLIHIGSPIPFNVDAFLEALPNLMAVAYANDETNIRAEVASLVPTYRPAGDSGRDKVNAVYKSLYGDNGKTDSAKM